MKKINNLSKREIPEVFNSLLENSKVLLKSAELLSQQGNFGVATSLAILGGEELVKAAFLYFHGKGFQFMQFEGFKGVFTNHAPKHEAAKVAELLKVFDAFEAWNGFNAGQVERKSNDKTLNKMSVFLEKTISSLKPLLKMGENIEWWKKADNLKNRGLYVDYQDGLLSPSQITSSGYERTINILSDFSNRFEKVKSFIDHMDKKNLKELVKQVNVMQKIKFG